MSYSYVDSSFLVSGWTHPCAWRGFLCHRLILSGRPALSGIVVNIIVHNTRSGGGPRHQVLVLAVAILYIKHIFFKCCTWVWEGPRLQLLLFKIPGTGAPRVNLWPCPNSEYASWVAPGPMARKARLIDATAEDGDSCNKTAVTTLIFGLWHR